MIMNASFKKMKMNNSHTKDNQSNKYRRKYKYLKKTIKSLIITNAALCDEVAKIQESIMIVKNERKFLLRKLLEYESEVSQAQAAIRNTVQTPITNGTSSNAKVKKRRSPEIRSSSIS